MSSHKVVFYGFKVNDPRKAREIYEECERLFHANWDREPTGPDDEGVTPEEELGLYDEHCRIVEFGNDEGIDPEEDAFLRNVLRVNIDHEDGLGIALAIRNSTYGDMHDEDRSAYRRVPKISTLPTLFKPEWDQYLKNFAERLGVEYVQPVWQSEVLEVAD